MKGWFERYSLSATSRSWNADIVKRKVRVSRSRGIGDAPVGSELNIRLSILDRKYSTQERPSLQGEAGAFKVG